MLQLLINYYHAHPTQVGVEVTWLVSLVIGNMPAPNGAGKGYQWLYGILQGIGANIKLRGAAGATIPNPTDVSAKPSTPSGLSTDPISGKWGSPGALSGIPGWNDPTQARKPTAEEIRTQQAEHRAVAKPSAKDFE